MFFQIGTFKNIAGFYVVYFLQQLLRLGGGIVYFVGIDGGGTRSRLRASFGDGREAAEYTGEATNLYALSRKEVEENLRRLLESFFYGEKTCAQECGGICVGSAGIDNEKNKREMEQILEELGLSCPMQVMNDTLLYLTAEDREIPCMIIVAGTGSNSFGRDRTGNVVHAGGWEYLLGDEGSGYFLGLEGLRAVMRAFDGRGERTSLTERILQNLGKTEVPQLMDFVYKEDTKKMDIARISVLVLKEAKKGDGVCGAILEMALNALLEHVKALHGSMGLSHEEGFRVLLHGGLFENEPQFREGLKEKIRTLYPNASVMSSERDGAACALSIAEKRLGEAIHEKLQS